MANLFIFDMGEVLLTGVATLDKIADYLSLDYHMLRADYDLYKTPLMDGFMDPDDYYRHIEIKYNIPRIDDDLFVRFFKPQLNTFMLEEAVKLKVAGNRCVVGSNTFKPHWDYIKASFPELLSAFDALYASHEIHLSKPSPEFWSYILEKENSMAENAIFIDDLEHNIEGARALGIKTFQYKKDDEEARRFLSRWINE